MSNIPADSPVVRFDRNGDVHFYGNVTTAVPLLEKNNVKYYGAKGDGINDDKAAITAAITAVQQQDGGGVLYFPQGVYLISGTVFITLAAANLALVLDPGAVIKAGPNFPWNAKGIQIISPASNLPAECCFTFRGGKIDGRAMRPVQAGFAADLLYFAPSVPGDGSSLVTRANFIDTEFITNDTPSGDAGDSHLFVAGASNIIISGCRFRGATDSAIYLSGDSSQTYGENVLIEGCFFDNNAVGITSKRQFKRTTVIGNFFKRCTTAVATAEADGFRLPGFATTVADNSFDLCGRCIEIRWCDSAVVSGNRITDFGIARDGFIFTEDAIKLSGSSHCAVTGNTIATTNITPTSGIKALHCTPYTVNGTSRDSTYNLFAGNVVNIPSGFNIVEEDANQDNNYFINNRFSGAATGITISGANSVLVRDGKTGSVYHEYQTYLGGDSTCASLRVSRSTTFVNRLNIAGCTGANASANGVVVGAEGSTTDINMCIQQKGAGVLLLGGPGGAEMLRVLKGGGVNAFEMAGGTSLAPMELRTRGANTNVSMKLVPKGAGAVQINLSNVVTYADDTAAGVGGLTAGTLYKTSTGQLMIKL